jgi:hypothetical protein
VDILLWQRGEDMKKFISGLLIGLIVAFSASVFAATYTAYTATFPVLVNGNIFTSDKPIVVINGSTYMPLKAIGEVLGVNVLWNADLKRVEVGQAYKQADGSIEFQDFITENSQTLYKVIFSDGFSVSVDIPYTRHSDGYVGAFITTDYTNLVVPKPISIIGFTNNGHVKTSPIGISDTRIKYYDNLKATGTGIISGYVWYCDLINPEGILFNDGTHICTLFLNE